MNVERRSGRTGTEMERHLVERTGKRLCCAILLLALVVLNSPVPTRGAENLADQGGLEPPPEWELLLEEPFDDNNNDWPVDVEENQWVRNDWQFANRTYRWEAEAKQATYWYVSPAHDPLDDFYLGVDIRKVSGAEDAVYGVVFRVDDDDNFYFLQIYDPGQFALWRRRRGEWFPLIDWSESRAIHPGQTNRLEVLAEGSEFSIAINGQEVVQASDDWLEMGWFGIAVQLWEAGDRAVFEFDKSSPLSNKC